MIAFRDRCAKQMSVKFPITVFIGPMVALLCLLASPMGCSAAEDLGHGYTRKGEHIFYAGKRIDQEVPHDLDFLKSFLKRELTIPKAVDAVSFEALSKDYSKDQSKVYYRWIRGAKFWVVEIADADPATFEVLGTALAKDKDHVWKKDLKVAGADARTTQVLATNGRVWKDQNHVWFSGNIIRDADATTFEALGDGFHYRDAKQVYWIFNVVKVVEGADPKTFKLKKPSPEKQK